MMDATTISDGRGGFTTKYVDGAEFDASVNYQGSDLNQIAEALSERTKYRVVTFRNVYLQPLSVFRRVSDGKILRVTKDGEDNTTPASAGLDRRVVTAEEFTLVE